MNIYAIYVNQEQKDNKFVVIKQGFSAVALLFNIFWALYYRMWLPLALALFVNIVVNLSSAVEIEFISKISLMLIFGFFASDIREYDLKQKEYSLNDLVLARTTEEAELKFLERNNV